MSHRLTAWMFDRTLPYWRRHGLDGRYGGFHERLDAAQRSGRGVVVCTAHYGNFKILAAAHTRRGVHATMITRAMGGAWFDRLWRRARVDSGVWL